MNERKKQDELCELLVSTKGGDVVLQDDLYEAAGLMARRSCSIGALDARGVVFVGPPAPELVAAPIRLGPAPFGSLSNSLMQVLDLEGALISIAMRNLIPRCRDCGDLSAKPTDPEALSLPSSGAVALVISDGEQDMPLRERCELLGVERAYVAGFLVQIEEISSDEGEPVLKVLSSERFKEERADIDDWFSRGGGPLKMVHFETRSSRGIEMATLHGSWVCKGCHQPVPYPSAAELYERSACRRCRGDGWLLVEHGRYVACEDCDGFGAHAEVLRSAFGSVSVRDIAALTIDDLVSLNLRLHTVESERLMELSKLGLGRYPLGAPLAWLSTGERVNFALASARLSRLKGVILAVDGPAIGCAEMSAGENESTPESDPKVVFFRPQSVMESRAFYYEASSEELALRSIAQGPLTIDLLTFPIGAASLIQGASSTGKSLLMREIAQRFSRRRKLAHLCSFGSISRCHLIDCGALSRIPLISLLGLVQPIAEQVCRSRAAKVQGIALEDLDPSRSRYRCPSCVERLEDPGLEVCELCSGSLFEWWVSQLPIGSSSVGELMVMTLARAEELMWANDVVAGVLARVPHDLKQQLSFATQADALAPSVQRFLVACAGLSRPLVEGKGRSTKQAKGAKDLILLDEPFAISSANQRIVIELIDQNLRNGATVICSGAPAPLVSCFRSVLVLRDCAVPWSERLQSRYMDRRFGRRSEVVSAPLQEGMVTR